MLTSVNGDCIVPDVLVGKGKTNDVFQNQVIRPRIGQREPDELEGKARVTYHCGSITRIFSGSSAKAK
jgi:hypothetical protein